MEKKQTLNFIVIYIKSLVVTEWHLILVTRSSSSKKKTTNETQQYAKYLCVNKVEIAN